MVLDSIEIRNYRSLKALSIPELGRVNLFTGRNNTGKSALLEAIALYASKGDVMLMHELLADRGEAYSQSTNLKNQSEVGAKMLSSMFTDRLLEFQGDSAITIGPIESGLFGSQVDLNNSVSFRFVRYTEDVSRLEDGRVRRNRVVVDDEKDDNLTPSSFDVGFEIRDGKNSAVFPLDSDRWFRGVYGMRNSQPEGIVQYIRPRGIDKEDNGRLWDKIALTKGEDLLIKALQIIEKNTERITFIEGTGRQRTAVIKLLGSGSVVPLRSMGDGINRILTIVLGAINANNGVLLIDEFENGLHHTAQEQLWEIIFEVAEQANVQVFATTHSDDCIRGFQRVVKKKGLEESGMYYRLENKNGAIRGTQYSVDELEMAMRHDIETR